MKKILAALRFCGELLGLVKPVTPVADPIMKAILEVVKEALPAVEWVAEQTAADWDDGVVKAFAELGIPAVENFLALPPEARWHATLELASRMVHRKFPSLPLFVINAAVEIAVAHVRGRMDAAAALSAGPRVPVQGN